jgi:methylated-DNA-[protein]-cysteine S-methyltransferase
MLLEAKAALLHYLDKGTFLPPFPLDVDLGTPFQKKVWEALLEIPFGETRSYLQISEAVEQPRSDRAVGQACGRNPIAVMIPCHRVLGSGGKLGGYSGGLHIKKALLDLESPRGADN